MNLQESDREADYHYGNHTNQYDNNENAVIGKSVEIEIIIESKFPSET